MADPTPNPLRASARRQNVLAFLVLAIAIGVGAFASHHTRTMVEQDMIKTLDGHTEHLREALVLRLQAYDELARGFRGLYYSGPAFDSASFTRYAESLDVANHLPSVHSISFAKRVPHAEIGRFLESVRRREEPGTTETRQFSIHPPGERPEYWVTEHAWPRRASEMLGFDLREDAARRATVERARDTGRPTASGPLRIVGDRMEKPGYALRFPIYAGGVSHATVDERRKHFQGVLSAIFWTEDLGREIIAESWATQLRLWLYDMGYRNEPEQPVLLFDSHPGEHPPPLADPRATALNALAPHFRKTIELHLGGRIWLLQFVSDMRPQKLLDQALPWIVFFGCLVTGLLVLVLFRSLFSTRARALELATRMTADLNSAYRKLEEEQRRTQQLIEVMPYPVFFKDRDGRYLGFNKAWEDFYRIGRERMLGKTIRELFVEDPDSRARAERDDQRLFQNPGTHISEPVLRTSDGVTHDVIIQKATFSRPDGTVGGMVGTIIDITERKQAERRQAMEHAVTWVLADFVTVADAIPRVIQTICEATGWLCGARWEADQGSGLLECREYWGVDTPEIREFLSTRANRVMNFDQASAGFAHRAYRAGQPFWISDIARENDLNRASLVAGVGLRGAFAFPVRLEAELLGVVEFFHRDARAPDAALIRVANAIGSQIGQFIQRKRAEQNLHFAATHDALTRLPNRHLFAESLTQALARAQRSHQMVGVLFVDLDHFKSINDTLGHQGGDEVLRETAARLTGALRQSDIVSRHGGDEFVALVEGLPDASTLTTIAEKILAALTQPYLVKGRNCHVTASIGISIYPEDGYDGDALLKNADTAMYQAKNQGRSAYRFFSGPPGMQSGPGH